jgi:hypothetical protein
MEQKELLAQLEAMKTALEASMEEKASKNFDEKIKAINEAITELKAVKPEVTAEELKAMSEKLDVTIKALDIVQTRMKATDFKPTVSKKSFGEAFQEQIAEVFESKAADFAKLKTDKNATVSFEIKAVGNMTLGANLTGDGVASYGNKQGLVPANKINFRDLIPTTPSPTGLYVTYRETGTEGAIAVQTEGAAKGQIDYDLTEVKVVSDYIAGFARFSKQMAYQLPFLQNTLPRLLLRDFYKKENSTFYGVVNAAATGNATVTPTVDAEQMVAWIANQLNADFTPSAAIINFTDWQNILLTKPSDYSIPGGVTIDSMGNIRICGVPVIGAAWATVDKMLLIDTDYLERVETESLRVELSYEDADNFTKNLITARVECFEDINLLRTDAHIFGDFGNVA